MFKRLFKKQETPQHNVINPFGEDAFNYRRNNFFAEHPNLCEEDDFVYKTPKVVCEIQEWINRRILNNVFTITMAGRGDKRGLYIDINLANAEEKGIRFNSEIEDSCRVFIETPMENGIDISRVLNFFRYYGVKVDWYMGPEYKKELQEADLEYEVVTIDANPSSPETVADVKNWVRRQKKHNSFIIHNELFDPEQSSVVYITVTEESGLDHLVGTHSLPYLKDRPWKELEHVISFLASFGVNPDW